MTKHKTPEAIAKEIVQLRAGAWGARLFKNNTGVAYTEQGRPVFFGLGNDGVKNDESFRTPDEVGWTRVLITPEMVGKHIPVFSCFDAKKLGFVQRASYPKGSREYGQQKFFDMVIFNNGIAGFASSAADVDRIYNEWVQRVTR